MHVLRDTIRDVIRAAPRVGGTSALLVPGVKSFLSKGGRWKGLAPVNPSRASRYAVLQQLDHPDASPERHGPFGESG